MGRSIIVMLLASVAAFAADLPVCKNKQNLVASGLVGTWVLDTVLTERLHGGVGPLPSAEIAITEDLSITNLFGPLGSMDKCAFLAGQMDAKVVKDGKENQLKSPFALTENAGNPTIWYDERGYSGSGPIKDLHRNFLMLAKGKTADKDILFWGGDYNNQALTALTRK